MKAKEFIKYLLMLVFLVFSINTSFCASGPDIKFDETEHDFGNIGQFEEHTYVFKFKNIGDENLNIESVSTSCGCTAALISSQAIPPKSSGEIKVVFDSGEFENKVTKTIYIQSNDPDEPTAKVQIKANITPMVYIEPRYINFGKIEKGNRIKKNIFISVNIEGLKITKLESSHKYISTNLSIIPEGTEIALEGRNVISKKDNFMLEMSLEPEAEVGKLNGYIRLHTNNAKRGSIQIILQGEILGDIRLEPDILSFGIVKDDSPKQYEIAINNVGKKVLEITKIESNANWFSTKLLELEKGRKYKIIVELKSNIEKGFSQGNIVVHTNNPEQPTLNVEVFASVIIN